MYKEIAIIGVSGKFPLANNLKTFHENLAVGMDCIQVISEERRKLLDLKTDVNYWKIGFIDQIDSFDNKFFGISNREAAQMSPEQRLSLELVAHTIWNAGYSLSDFRGSNCGVFLSSSDNEYQDIIEEETGLSFIGNMKFMLPGKIAFTFDLHGPSMMIDTGCSATLVALHEACMKLASEEIEYALVGGININLVIPEINTGNILNVNATDGRSKSFDYRADGTGAGEGGGYLLLKNLESALSDKDYIYGIIKGSSVNNDGARSSDVVSPSVEGQKEAMLRAWSISGINVDNITEFEAHGTGTKIGDPIEISGIEDSLKEVGCCSKQIELGALKSNIGHLMQAAGVASIIKVLMGYKYNVTYPLANFEKPNPLIDFEHTILTPTKEIKYWKSDNVRITGINAFSISGTNAHVLIQNYINSYGTKEDIVGEKNRLVKISANTENSFLLFVKELRGELRKSDYNLNDVAFTLNVGRDDYQYRDIFYVHDLNDLCDKLDHAIPQKCSRRRKLIYITDQLVDENKLKKIQFLKEVGIYPDLILHINKGNEIFLSEIEGALCEISSNIENIDSFAEYIGNIDPMEEYIFADFTIDSIKDILDYANKGIICSLNEESDLYKIIMNCYLNGFSINWRAYYQGESYFKLPLPTYVFENKRHWGKLKKNVRSHDKLMIDPNVPVSVCKNVNIEEVRQEIADIWKTVLELDEELSAQDDFFELGGNSILVALLNGEIERKLGCEIEISDVFENSIFDSFVDMIHKTFLSLNTGYVEDNAGDNVDTFLKTDRYPLTSMQRLILNNYFEIPDTNAWNMTAAFKIVGNLDVVRLENAFNKLISINESMRTIIFEENGEYYQKFQPELTVKLEPQNIEENNVITAIDLQLRHQVHILDNPLFRVNLYKVSKDLYYLGFVINHVIADGWSMVNIFRQISLLYNNGDISLDIAQFKEYVIREHSLWGSDRYKYWSKEIENIELPIKPKYICEDNLKYGFKYMKIDSTTTTKLQELIRRYNTSNFYVFLLVYHLTITKCTGNNESTIGIATANRKNKYRNSIGCYVVLPPNRMVIHLDKTSEELIGGIKELASKTIGNQEWYVGNEAANLTTEYYLAYQNFKDKESELLELNNLSVNAFNIDNLGAMLPIIISAYEDTDSILCTVSYDKRFFMNSFIDEFIEQFKIVMEQVVMNSQMPVEEFIRR